MKKLLFVIPLLVFLATCASPAPMGGVAGPSDGSDATSAPAMPVVTEERPAPPETAPTLTPDTSFLSIPNLPPPPTEPIPTPAFSPILYRQYVDRYFSYQVLGGYQDGIWLTDEDIMKVLKYEQQVDVYDDNGWFGTTTIHDISTLDPSFCGKIFVGSDLLEMSGWQFAFYQGWQVTVRPWTEISTDVDIYRIAVKDWLIKQGFSNPQVQVSRILRVDLEGDGADEVFISASYFKVPNPQSPLAEFGDYSIVLMRKVFGNDVITIPIVADLYHNSRPEPLFPFTYELSGFLDLNQDENLEVILDMTCWEGNGMVVYELRDGNIIQVISEICME